jgi:hypothetical protein
MRWCPSQEPRLGPTLHETTCGSFPRPNRWEESWSQGFGMRCDANGMLLPAGTPGNSDRALRKLKTSRRGNSSYNRNVCNSASNRTSEGDTEAVGLTGQPGTLPCSLCTILRESISRKHYNDFLTNLNQSHFCCIL